MRLIDRIRGNIPPRVWAALGVLVLVLTVVAAVDGDAGTVDTLVGLALAFSLVFEAATGPRGGD